MTDGSSPGTSEMASVSTLAGGAQRSESTALDDRQMLANAIHFADVCAAAKQGRVDRLLVSQSHSVDRLGQQCRAAAGDQANHQIILAQSLDLLNQPASCVQTRLVGHRM